MTAVIHSEILMEDQLNQLNSKRSFDRLSAERRTPELWNSGVKDKKHQDSAESEVGTTVNSNITDLPNSYKKYGNPVLNSRFIKLIPSEAAFWLMAKHPTAYLLLNLIATRAQRIPNHPSGLKLGEAMVGDYESIGSTRQKYRTALDVLTRMKYISICETCRSRKKSTINTTTYGTKVKLLSSDIWDINLETTNHPINHRPTTDQPPTNHEQERLDLVVDVIDLGKNLDEEVDPRTVLQFRHQKKGKIQIGIEQLKNELLEQGWKTKEIFQAIEQMKSQDPELFGSIKTYILKILENIRQNQNTPTKEKPCKNQQQKNQESSSKERLPKDRGYSLDEDMSESPLAKFARQTGLK